MNPIVLDFERAKALYSLFATKLRSILHGSEIDSGPVLSHTQSPFGKWLYDHALKNYGHLPEMRSLEKAHLKIHQAANNLFVLYKKGKIEEAREGLSDLEMIGADLTGLLAVLEKKITAEVELNEGLSEEYQDIYAGFGQLSDASDELEQLQSQTAKAERVRKQVLDAESKFRNVMLQAPVGIAILAGLDFVVEMANETYLGIVDRKEEELVGRPLFVSLPEVREFVEPILCDVYKSGMPFYGNEFEVIIKRFGKAGRCYFNFVYQPLVDEDGTVSGIVVVATEVTQQIMAKHALEKSEIQFRNLVTQSQFAKAIFKGEDFIISLANESLLKNIWRRQLYEVQGRKLFDVFPELVGQKFENILKTVYHEGTLHRENEAFAYVDGPDGVRQEFYLDFQYAPIFEADGSVSGIMVSVNDVTEKVKFRQQISENAERLTLAIEGAKLATWDLTIATRHIVYSGRLATIFGYPESRMLTHQDLRDHVHPDDRQNIVEKAFAAALETGNYYYEARLIRNDGSIRWIRTQGKVLYDADRTPMRMLGTMMDITEEKRASQIIKENEKRIRDLVEIMPVAIYTVDEKGFVSLFNKAASELWGVRPEIGKDEWCGSYEMYSLDGEFLPKDKSPMAAALLERRAMTEEVFVKRPDNSLRHVIMSPQPIYDTHGAVTGGLNVIIDITDRKKAELALKTSEGKFRTLADSMPQLVWTSDGEGNLNYFNQSIYNYSGLTAEEIGEEGLMQLIHPDELPVYRRLWKVSVENGIDFVFEHRMRRADGVYRWHLTRAIPQKEADKSIQMWVGTSTDIHDSKIFIDKLEGKVEQRTKELTVANNELIRTNMELAQFAYVASHDLQEPLRKIQTFTTRILETENQNLSDRGKDYFRRMQASSTRMQQLIIDLLAFSRANVTEEHLEHTDLNVLLQSVKDQLSDLIQQKRATIIAQKLPHRDVIVYQFEQLFTNLIANSLKFVAPGRDPVIQITVGKIAGEMIPFSVPDPEEIYQFISFSDNGIGFDPQYKDRIFQVFQRLHNRNAYEGTGIGLAICKKIVDNHRGFIDAVSEPGEGATFTIYLKEDSF
jgi:PAS domain S-box-containing protein